MKIIPGSSQANYVHDIVQPGILCESAISELAKEFLQVVYKGDASDNVV